MSRYATTPLDLKALKTVPLEARGGKVRVEDFGAPYSRAISESKAHRRN